LVGFDSSFKPKDVSQKTQFSVVDHNIIAVIFIISFLDFTCILNISIQQQSQKSKQNLQRMTMGLFPQWIS